MQRSVVCASHTWASANLGSVNGLSINAYTHSGWFCADSAGFGRKCTSCVRTSAFLHVFYVSCVFVIFPCRSFVHVHICVFPCVYMFNVCVWASLFMSMFIVQNNDVFSMRNGQWKSHTLRYGLLLWVSPAWVDAAQWRSFCDEISTD